jgi:undecaprenyl-diphosphatase
MDTLHAVAIAVLQGATELFPVSSLGHAVLVPALLGWPVDQQAPGFLPFLVMLHVGTAAALLAYFWRDWWMLAIGVVGLASPHQVGESRRVAWLIIVATIPAIILGGAFEHPLRRLFGSPLMAAAFLVINGAMLIMGERLRGRGERPLSSLRAADALAIGIWQCLALLPGISRSGATIVGALLRGVDHESAAHFSFLIATPIILAATVLEVPKLLHADVPSGAFSVAALAAVVAGLVAFLSTWLLMHWFRRQDERHENWALDPFGWYCLAVGGGAITYLTLA